MRVLTLAAGDLRLTLRDRGALFWLFMAPVLWVYLFGFAVRSTDPSKVKVGLLVSQEDASPRAARFVELLRGENFDVTVRKPGEAVPEGDDPPPRSLTIPPDFGDAIAHRRKVVLDMKTRSGANPEATFAAQVALHKAIVRYLASEALGGLDPESDLVHVRSAWAAAKKMPSGYYQSIPGNLVMFVLISTLTYGAGLLAQERKKGLLRRLASSPMRVAEIISGKLLGRAATASIQSGVFLVLGLFVFRIDWGRSPAGLLLVVASLVLCAAGLGLLSGCLFASGEAASGLGIVFSLVMSALGGCWWPAEVMPAWLRAAGLAFPTTWAMRGLHEVLSWGGGIREVLLPSAILLLYAAGAAGLAASRFRASAR